MRSLWAALIVCASVLSFVADARAQAATATPRATERVRVGGELGFAVFLPSRYAQTLALFGHGHLAVGTSVAVRATARVANIVVIGGRLGLLHTGSLPTPPTPPTRAVHYNLADATVVLGLSTNRRSSATGLLNEIVIEAGGVLGDASLDKVSQLVGTFRVGGSAMVGGYFSDAGVYVALRVAVTYSPWNGAGGWFWDSTFSSFTTAIEVGGLR